MLASLHKNRARVGEKGVLFEERHEAKATILLWSQLRINFPPKEPRSFYKIKE